MAVLTQMAHHTFSIESAKNINYMFLSVNLPVFIHLKSSFQVDFAQYLEILFQDLNATIDVENDPILVTDPSYFKSLAVLLSRAKPESIRKLQTKVLAESNFLRNQTQNFGSFTKKYVSLILQSAWSGGKL